jgi:hypothetical protein
MLTITRTQWFSWTFAVADGARHVGDVACGRWGARGVLAVDGVTFTARREARFSGDYLLVQGATTVARATRVGLVRQAFDLRHDGEHYVLARRGFFDRSFVLRRGDREIGVISRTALFSRDASADLPVDLPLPVRFFVIWLVVSEWKRAARAAAAS